MMIMIMETRNRVPPGSEKIILEINSAEKSGRTRAALKVNETQNHHHHVPTY